MSDERRWRVGHLGRDQMYYEEWHGGAWQRIRIDGEMLTGPAHHVIYFASPSKWREYPAWARDRREAIVARITSEFRPPEYEYYGLDGDVSSGASLEPSSSPPAPRSAAGRKPAPQGYRALLLAVVLLLALSAAAGGMAWRGVQNGETTLRIPRTSVSRPVQRSEDPAMFWVIIGIFGTVTGVALALGLLAAREAGRMSASQR